MLTRQKKENPLQRKDSLLWCRDERLSIRKLLPKVNSCFLIQKSRQKQQNH